MQTLDETECFDDRLFVLEVRQVEDRREGEEKWALITRRNTWNYPVYRADGFATKQEDIDYLISVEPETPRISLEGKSPEETPDINEHRDWVRSIGGRESYIDGSEIGEPFYEGKTILSQPIIDGDSLRFPPPVK